jgi:glycosyltransferase involved in cell wall biosynthesis
MATLIQVLHALRNTARARSFTSNSLESGGDPLKWPPVRSRESTSTMIADDINSDRAFRRSEVSIVAFGLDDWGNNPQTRRHILTRLATRGWRVTYANGPHFVWDIKEPRWQYASWRNRLGESDGLFLNWAGRWLARWPRFTLWDKLVVHQYMRALIKHSVWKEARYRVAYVFHPSFLPYVEKLGDCHVVYHADDSFSKMPTWTTDTAIAERNLVSKAAMVIASSPGIQRNLSGVAVSSTRILENGADVKLFMAGAEGAQPTDLCAIPRPRIGYFGSINPKVDLCLVERLARLKPHWQWVFVGQVIDKQILADPPTREAWLRIASCANIHFLGVRPYSDIPRYQAHMDVNVLCYRTEVGGWWTDLSPLKLHEYLAIGKPVVAAGLEVLIDLQHVVATASGETEWLEALREAIEGGGRGTVAQRREVALANDWDRIVDRLDLWLTSMVTAARKPLQQDDGVN